MHVRFLLSVTSLAALALSASAQQVVRTFHGEAGAQAGAAVVRAGDLNNDGFDDLLVGEPGFGDRRGRVECVSGAFLASGSGSEILWTLEQPWIPDRAKFGSAIAMLDDYTGDGVREFAVGAPGTPDPNHFHAGAVYVFDGASTALYALLIGADAHTHYGFALATVGDATGDGWLELAVGAPGEDPNPLGEVWVMDGAVLAAGGFIDAYLTAVGEGFGSYGYGSSIAGGFDLEHDGQLDMVIGSPYSFAGDRGEVAIRTVLGFNAVFWGRWGEPGEQLGMSVDAAHDYDGDGTVDFLLGAPGAIGSFGQAEGRVLVISGASIPFSLDWDELYELKPAECGLVPSKLARFGESVRACEDLNQDGMPDILVGAVGFANDAPPFTSSGAAVAVSGATGVALGRVIGASQDRLGDEVGGTVGDLDGDGFPEFVVAGPFSDNPAADCGTVKAVRLFPSAPSVYCKSQPNSLACVPAIGWSGTPSASSTLPFLVTCANVINAKSGLLFYSHHPKSVAFLGGTLCVRSPLRRTPVLDSGGSPTGTDCSGVFSFDFGNWLQSDIDPTLGIGAEVFAQFWSRDPQSASATNLSDALRFVVNP